MQREERFDELKVSPTNERVKGYVKFVSLKIDFRDQFLGKAWLRKRWKREG